MSRYYDRRNQLKRAIADLEVKLKSKEIDPVVKALKNVKEGVSIGVVLVAIYLVVPIVTTAFWSGFRNED